MAAAARLIGSACVATLAAPVVFLVGYVLTYQKIPPFPPAGAANKVFYVALVATLAAAAARRWRAFRALRSPGPLSLLAAVWIGSTKLADPDATTLTILVALVVGGGVALWGLDRLATLAPPFGGGAAALAGLAAVAALTAPTLLFGGSSTGVGLCLGLAAGAAVLSADGPAARIAVSGPPRCSARAADSLAALDTIALVTRRADPFALSLIALAPFLGPWPFACRRPPGEASRRRVDRFRAGRPVTAAGDRGAAPACVTTIPLEPEDPHAHSRHARFRHAHARRRARSGRVRVQDRPVPTPTCSSSSSTSASRT